MAKKQSVIIFGGAFNPPTLAHEAIIKLCLALPQFSEVWLMPSDDRDDKLVGTPGEHRLRMLEAVKVKVFNNDPRLVISDLELTLNGSTKTHKTVSILAIKHPNVDFWFAFGNDSYRDMPNWEKGYQLKTRLSMVVFGDTPPADLSAKNLFISVSPEFSLVSASQARNELRQNNVTNLVNPAVTQYAISHKVYPKQQ